MIKILHTLMEVANAGLADAVRKEAEKVLGILSEAYGDADGGYVAVCDNFQDGPAAPEKQTGRESAT